MVVLKTPSSPLTEMRRTRTARSCTDCQLVVLHAEHCVKLTKRMPTLIDHFSNFVTEDWLFAKKGAGDPPTSPQKPRAGGPSPRVADDNGDTAKLTQASVDAALQAATGDATHPKGPPNEPGASTESMLRQVLQKLDEQSLRIAQLETKVAAQ